MYIYKYVYIHLTLLALRWAHCVNVRLVMQFRHIFTFIIMYMFVSIYI